MRMPQLSASHALLSQTSRRAEQRAPGGDRMTAVRCGCGTDRGPRTLRCSLISSRFSGRHVVLNGTQDSSLRC